MVMVRVNTTQNLNHMTLDPNPQNEIVEGQCLGSRHVGPPTAMFWGTDLSAPQRQFAGEPTGLLPNARQPTCRLPNDNMLGSRHVCSRTPDSRPVGALTPICWGADMSGLQRRCSIGCSGPDCLYIALRRRVRSQLTAAFICGAQK